MLYFWIAIGSAIGGVGRYWCSELIVQRLGDSFPWHTITVNILGSFIIGLFAGLTDGDGRLTLNHEFRQFVMIGLCGGYTTFSTFSLQTLNLFHNGEFLQAGFNIMLSVALCLAFVWLGYTLAMLLTPLSKI